jgi:S1-C subfamily serine protease
MPNRRQRRLALLVAAVTLLTAGAAFAVASALSGNSQTSGTTDAVASGSGAWLGIDVESSRFGVMVVNVIPGSPAYRAGMETGDVITKINGHTVYAPSDVTKAIAHLHPGDQLAIQYHGSGSNYSQQITLANRPAGYP